MSYQVREAPTLHVCGNLRLQRPDFLRHPLPLTLPLSPQPPHHTLVVAGIEQIRFGYVNRTANSVLTYEENETDITVFPGKKIIAI